MVFLFWIIQTVQSQFWDHLGCLHGGVIWVILFLLFFLWDHLGWVYLGGEGYTFFGGGTLGYFFSLTIGSLWLLQSNFGIIWFFSCHLCWLLAPFWDHLGEFWYIFWIISVKRGLCSIFSNLLSQLSKEFYPTDNFNVLDSNNMNIDLWRKKFDQQLKFNYA